MATATKSRKSTKAVEKTEKPSVYDTVTAKIVELMERGVCPWSRPWDAPGLLPALPLRHNGEHYNGINILILWISAMEKGYRSSFWMTYQQAQELKAQVRKGEKATVIVYANTFDKKSKDETTGEESVERIPYLKTYCVFNADQIDGLPESFYAKAPERNAAAQANRRKDLDELISATGATITENDSQHAYYDRSADSITLPAFEYFKSADAFYATSFHELAHWTGAPHRLNRIKGEKPFDEKYCREELVAELAAAFLCAACEVSPAQMEQSAAYLSHFVALLKDDSKAIFRAATLATAAAEYILAASGK